MLKSGLGKEWDTDGECKNILNVEALGMFVGAELWAKPENRRFPDTG